MNRPNLPFGQPQVTFKDDRARHLFEQNISAIRKRTDHMFLLLFGLQWIMAIAFALDISPQTWAGAESSVHEHVYFALILGGLITSLPAFLILRFPGRTLTRQCVAVSQILFSILLIHLSGGRIETHFHIFGSLAFLAFYRDRNVVITATLLTAADHLLRGAFFPESVYGVLTSTPWRAFEHSAWVAFEDGFLFYSIANSITEMQASANLQVDLEIAYLSMENKILERTRELTESRALILEQQNAMVASAKNAALGEMAGQAAHEINTPLGALMLTAQSLETKLDNETLDKAYFRRQVGQIISITARMARIVSSMRKMAGHGANESFTSVRVKDFVEDLTLLCEGRFKKASIKLDINYNGLEEIMFQCRANEISQIIVNLFNNAHDAIKERETKWVCLEISLLGEKLRFAVSDSGPGISPSNREKLFQPNFTTKSLAVGTGFGLSISRKIAERHHGSLIFDPHAKNTRFVLEIPRDQANELVKMVVNS